MIDRWLLPMQARALAPMAQACVRAGMSADRITITGFALGMLALPALATGLYGLALGLIVLNRIADGLDGAVARLTRPTDRGAYLDIALDFVFYAAVPLGFALADPAANALPAAVLLAGFIGTGSSFLAFATLSAKRGAPVTYPGKGIAYLGGLTEGAETIVAFVLMCLIPHAFAPIAWVFAAACAITTLARWAAAWAAFADPR